MTFLHNMQLERDSKTVQKVLVELDRAAYNTPYGKHIMRRAIAPFLSIPKQFIYTQLTTYHKLLVSRCFEGHSLLANHIRIDLYWIQAHELIRKFIITMLSFEKNKPYMMDNAELSQWCSEVFLQLKKSASNVLRRQEEAKDGQTCVDAMYELVYIVRTLDDKTLLHEYYEYFIKLCGRLLRFPRGFIMPFPQLGPRAPNDDGASAIVYHGFLDGGEVAIKSFRLYDNPRKPKLKLIIQKCFLKEALILQILHHPNIVPFIGAVLEPNRFCIVTPWMKNGNAREFLKANPDASGKELLEQVADGLSFMHQHSVVHSDLKGANILINESGKALISDVGSASIQEYTEVPPISSTARKKLLRECREALRQGGKSISSSLVSSVTSRISSLSGAGTLRWMAPERLVEDYGDNEGRPTFPSDVFSFAMLAIELFTGQVPHPGCTRELACLHTIAGRRPHRPSNVADPVWGVIRDCWLPEPAARPSILCAYNRLACIP